MRICTGEATDPAAIPNDVPAARTYPPALILRLLTSRLAMLVGG